MAKVVLVVASNREDQLQAFQAAWTAPPWDEAVVVEDGPQRSFDLRRWPRPGVHHVSWAEIAADEDIPAPTLISRRDSAIKMYGFWAALRLRADIVISLDDDCFPSGPPDRFAADHIAALSPRPRWVPSVAGSPTRGLPYFDLGTMEGAVANVGLWRGVGDFDSPQSLVLHRLGYLDDSYAPASGNRLMHPKQYWPFCGMNIAFRRAIAPLMYMPKMGDGSPYGRFDDIWCGIILQRCCRHLDLPLAVGDPHVRHARASDPLVNLEKEAPGIRANEIFWKVVETTPLEAGRHATPLSCAEAVAAHLGRSSRNGSPDNPDFASYLTAESERMQAWCAMFRKAGWE